jgi:flagellin-like hook-associated protein FlgL
MIGGPNPGTYLLTNIYTANNQLIADSLTRIASGKRIQRPSDDFAGFARASSLQSDITAYESIKQNIEEVKGFAVYAAEVGNDLVEDFDRLKELQVLYTGAAGDSVKQATYKAEYDATILRIADLIDDAYFDDVQVYRAGVSLKSVEVNPENSSLVINVQASAVGDETSINDITTVTANAIQNELENAQVYVMEMESFSTMLQRQLNLTDTIISSKESTISAITDIDEIEELSALTMLQVRQEATISMLAQANIIQGYAAQLYGGST